MFTSIPFSQTPTKFKCKKAVVMRMALEQALKDLEDDAVVG